MSVVGAKVVRQWSYSSPLIACRFSPNGKHIVTAAHDRSLQVWDAAAGDSQATPRILKGHESWLRAIGFSLDSQTLFTAGYDGRLIFWDLNDPSSNRPILQVDAHNGWVRCLDVSPDGRWLAMAGNDHSVSLWDASTAEPLARWNGHDSDVYSVYFHPDEPVLLTGDLLGKIHQWDLDSITERPKLMRSLDGSDLHTFHRGQGAHYGGIRSFALSPDGSRLACGGLHKATNPFGAVQEPLILVFDYTAGKKVQSLTADGITRGIIWRCLYHPDGTLIGASGGGSGGYLLFWDDAEKTSSQVKLPNTALDMDLAPEGQQIATAHHFKKLVITELS